MIALAGCGSSKHTASPPAPTSNGIVVPGRVAAPHFVLRDQRRRPTGPQLLRGHWLVVTFLYTHCPDVCPLIADQLAAAQRQNADLRVIAVSVDPARDTPAAVRRFLVAHHAGPHFSYVSGTRRILAPVWRSFHVAALPGPQGTVSHSALSILVDRDGRERRLFDSGVTAGEVLAAIKA